jgi:hypothetical protein
MFQRIVIAVIILASFSVAQRRIDRRNACDRILCIVPIVGTGIASDPRRFQYAPCPHSQDPNGIIGYYFLPTDDGKSAVVEFVARNRTAFQSILNNKTIKPSLSGTIPRETSKPLSSSPAKTSTWTRLRW